MSRIEIHDAISRDEENILKDASYIKQSAGNNVKLKIENDDSDSPELELFTE